jgi:hypothetical protein
VWDKLKLSIKFDFDIFVHVDQQHIKSYILLVTFYKPNRVH